MRYLIGFVCIIGIGICLAFLPKAELIENDGPILSDEWYQGKAEISTFELKQNRYNALHNGELVMIFVTEDFLKDKQVKNDSYTSKNSVPVIKNNRIRKFNTGLYDYSIYTSVFTDVSHPENVNTLKVTMSSQDWCGQSFSQLNNVGKQNKISGFSYFESEGDREIKVKDVFLIDEVFNMVRLGDKYLPQQRFQAMPSLVFTRLKHKPDAIVEAYGTLSQNDDGTKTYTINIDKLLYTLEIQFNDNIKRDIINIKESYPSAFDNKVRTTEASRKQVQWLDYWNKNSIQDSSLRAELNLN